MRVVLDTNVLISATFSAHGNPAQILALWQQGLMEVVISEAAIEELRRVLEYPQVKRFCRYSADELEEFVQLLRSEGVMVTPGKTIDIVSDVTDNLFLEMAVAGNATIVVSGDKHLLAVGRFQEIEIVTPAIFLAL